jgi:endonuclease-3
MTKSRRLSKDAARAVLAALHDLYPDADVELDWQTPLDLLVATILSAQSTDERVNQVTADLFRKYRTAADYAAADPERFQEEIHSTGFFRQKTKSVLGAAQKIVDDFGGEVPRTMDELVTLPGVARKTANLVLGTAFGEASGVVVDTHVKRVAFRLGITLETSPEKVERDLMEALAREEWIFAGHALILHGRRVCVAKKPRCSECRLAEWCPRNGVTASA